MVAAMILLVVLEVVVLDQAAVLRQVCGTLQCGSNQRL